MVIQLSSKILPKELEKGNIAYCCMFSKEIYCDGSFHIPGECQRDLLYMSLRPELFFTGASVCFHSLDCLFDKGS